MVFRKTKTICVDFFPFVQKWLYCILAPNIVQFYVAMLISNIKIIIFIQGQPHRNRAHDIQETDELPVYVYYMYHEGIGNENVRRAVSSNSKWTEFPSSIRYCDCPSIAVSQTNVLFLFSSMNLSNIPEVYRLFPWWSYWIIWVFCITLI